MPVAWSKLAESSGSSKTLYICMLQAWEALISWAWSSVCFQRTNFTTRQSRPSELREKKKRRVYSPANVNRQWLSNWRIQWAKQCVLKPNLAWGSSAARRRVEGNHLGRRKWGQPQTGKAKESVGEQWGVKELQKYWNSDGFSLTVSQYFWPRQKSGRHHCDWCVANRQEHFSHGLGGRSNSTERIWTPREACPTIGPEPNSARGCSFPLHLWSKKLQMGTACWTILATICLFCKTLPSKKFFFSPQNCLIWMKNSIKRAVMF